MAGTRLDLRAHNVLGLLARRLDSLVVLFGRFQQTLGNHQCLALSSTKANTASLCMGQCHVDRSQIGLLWLNGCNCSCGLHCLTAFRSGVRSLSYHRLVFLLGHLADNTSGHFHCSYDLGVGFNLAQDVAVAFNHLPCRGSTVNSFCHIQVTFKVTTEVKQNTLQGDSSVKLTTHIRIWGGCNQVRKAIQSSQPVRGSGKDFLHCPSRSILVCLVQLQDGEHVIRVVFYTLLELIRLIQGINLGLHSFLCNGIRLHDRSNLGLNVGHGVRSRSLILRLDTVNTFAQSIRNCSNSRANPGTNSRSNQARSLDRAGCTEAVKGTLPQVGTNTLRQITGTVCVALHTCVEA